MSTAFIHDDHSPPGGYGDVIDKAQATNLRCSFMDGPTFRPAPAEAENVDDAPLSLVDALALQNKLVDARYFELDTTAPSTRGSFGALRFGHYRGNRCAMKVIVNSNGGDATKLFENEASALLSVPTHPNLVDFIGASIDSQLGQGIFVGTVEGGNLEENLDKLQNASLALACVRSTTTALQHLHRNGWTHNDVKEANLMFNNSSVVLVDYGLVRRAGDAALCPAPLAPPEVVSGTPCQPNVDIYCLGRVMKNVYDRHHEVWSPFFAAAWLNLADNCCCLDPEARPDSESVLSSLNELESKLL